MKATQEPALSPSRRMLVSRIGKKCSQLAKGIDK
jgi:hypothetical protein